MSTINLIALGMAGNVKTTFAEKIEEEIVNKDKESYIINLDPSVRYFIRAKFRYKRHHKV